MGQQLKVLTAAAPMSGTQKPPVTTVPGDTLFWIVQAPEHTWKDILDDSVS